VNEHPDFGGIELEIVDLRVSEPVPVEAGVRFAS
jgi:hypothetical protein